MVNYAVEVPRWISIPGLIIGIVFGLFWIYSAYNIGAGPMFIVFGVIFMLAWIAIGLYIVITKRYPYLLKQVK